MPGSSEWGPSNDAKSILSLAVSSAISSSLRLRNSLTSGSRSVELVHERRADSLRLDWLKDFRRGLVLRDWSMSNRMSLNRLVSRLSADLHERSKRSGTGPNSGDSPGVGGKRPGMLGSFLLRITAYGELLSSGSEEGGVSILVGIVRRRGEQDLGLGMRWASEECFGLKVREEGEISPLLGGLGN